MWLSSLRTGQNRGHEIGNFVYHYNTWRYGVIVAMDPDRDFAVIRFADYNYYDDDEHWYKDQRRERRRKAAFIVDDACRYTETFFPGFADVFPVTTAMALGEEPRLLACKTWLEEMDDRDRQQDAVYRP